MAVPALAAIAALALLYEAEEDVGYPTVGDPMFGPFNPFAQRIQKMWRGYRQRARLMGTFRGRRSFWVIAPNGWSNFQIGLTPRAAIINRRRRRILDEKPMPSWNWFNLYG